METRTDKIQLEVVIGGSDARRKLAELTQETVKLGEQQKNLKAQEKALMEQRRAMSKSGDAAGVKRLNTELAELRTTLGGVTKAIAANGEQSKVFRDKLGLAGLTARELRKEVRALQAALDAAVPGTEQYTKLEAKLLAVKARANELTTAAGRQARQWDAMRGSMRVADMTMEQLEQESRRLSAALYRLNPNSGQWSQLNRDLQIVDRRLTNLRSGLGPFGRMWKEVKTNVLSAGAVLGGMMAGGAMISGFKGLVNSSAEYSDALVDVEKTTGLTAEVTRELASELSRLDTRTARAELLQLARDAGKLGITAKQDVLEFVRAGNQINVALGEDLGDDAIKNIGKLVDLFQLKEQFGLENSILKVGSALNELGMASTASEGYMVEFMKRMGGIAPLANITLQQTLGLGATLDSLGQTSEVSSTALSKLFIKMARDAQQYAAIAGKSVEEFTALMNTDAMEAFTLVLEGSNKTEGGLVKLTETLGDLGVDGSRAAGVFGVLANNTDRLRAQTAIANKAFAEGTSITEEYEKKNNNLAATLEKLGKEFNRLFVNNTMLEWVEGLVDGTRKAVDWIERHRRAIGTFLRVLASAASGWVAYKVAVAATHQVQLLAATATRALGVAQAVLAGRVSAGTVAMRAFNVATRANPIGLVIGLLTTAIGLFYDFGDAVNEAAEEVARETTELQLLHAQILTTNVGTDERTKLIEELKQKYPEYLSQIDADTVSNEELGRAIAEVNQQLINKAVLQRADKELEEQNARAAEKRLEQFERERKLRALLVQLSNESGVPLEAAPDVVTQARQFQRAPGTFDKLSGFQLSELDKQVRGVQAFEEAFRRESAASNVLLEKRQELMGELNMSSQKAKQTYGDWYRSISVVHKGLEETTGAVEKHARTVAELNEQIKALKEQQDLATAPGQYQELARQIAKLEAERDAITGGKPKDVQKLKDDLEALENELFEFRERIMEQGLSADERDLRQLDVKHAAELAKLKANKLATAADLTALEMAQEQERADLIAGQAEERLKGHSDMAERIRQAMLSDAQSELDAEERKWRELIDLAKKLGPEYEDTVVALEEKMQAALQQVRDKAAAKEKQEQLDKDEAARRARIQALQDRIDIYQGVNQAIGGVNQLLAAAYQASGNALYENTVAAKTLGLAQIAISTGVAVMEAIKGSIGVGFPGNLAAIGLSVGAVLSGVAQAMSFINSANPTPPNFSNTGGGGGVSTVPYGEQGMVITGGTGGGVLGGSRHSDGGNLVVDTRTGRAVANIEKDELMLIMSRKSTRANADLIPTLLQASKEGRRLPVPNMGQVRSAMQMAGGGVLSDRNTQSRGTALVNGVGPGGTSDVLLTAILKRLARIDAGVHSFPTELHATTSLREGERRKLEYDKLKARNRVERRKRG